MALPPLPTPGISTAWGTTLNTYLNALAAATALPAGLIFAFGGTVAPNNTVLCRGQLLARTGTYANLFAAIGTSYGAGDGSTTFAAPNLRGRVPVGMFASAQGNGLLDNLGETGGEQAHVTTLSEMPGHAHDMSHGHTTDAQGAHSHTVSQGTAAAVAGGGVATVIDDVYHNEPTTVAGSHGHNISTLFANTGSAGGGLAHNNLQPYIVVNYVITLG